MKFRICGTEAMTFAITHTPFRQLCVECWSFSGEPKYKSHTNTITARVIATIPAALHELHFVGPNPLDVAHAIQLLQFVAKCSEIIREFVVS